MVDNPIRLRTIDGVELLADLSVAAPAWAGAVVCHPHPSYGGDRHNAVVAHIFRMLGAAGVTVLRFDFRRSEAPGSGAEQHDVVAAVDPRPVLVLAAEHDQYNPPDRLRDTTATWPDAPIDVIPGADHFLHGAADTVAATTLAWLRGRTTSGAAMA